MKLRPRPERFGPNPIIDLSDSYKFCHWEALPTDLEGLFAYLESRGGRYKSTVFFGLQAILEEFFTVLITPEMVDEAEEFETAHGFDFNRAGWDRIVNVHGGRLPIRIKAVKEGSVVPFKNALLTVESMDSELAWLVTYVETALVRMWYPMTVATRIHEMKRKIVKYWDKAATNLDGLGFALLDFSARGCTSLGANFLGGSAYLASFMGSDSAGAIRYANYYYRHPMAGFSVKATEHSVMCSYTREYERDSFRQLINRVGRPGKILSVVSDTWDIYQATQYWAELAPEVKALGVKLVVRPDSGEYLEVLPKLYAILEKGFGYTINQKGYKVLDGVQLLWGDGIDENSIEPILDMVVNQLGYSPETILLGSGGGLMQNDINRDTSKVAYKASAVKRRSVNAGEWFGISKNPITDPGKMSKQGRLMLVHDAGGYSTVQEGSGWQEDQMDVVFEMSTVLRIQDLEDIRTRLWNDLRDPV